MGEEVKHALMEKSSTEQIAIAAEAADWMVDAVATSTQDRKYLRGDPECDEYLCDVIEANAMIAALRAIHSLK